MKTAQKFLEITILTMPFAGLACLLLNPSFATILALGYLGIGCVWSIVFIINDKN